MMRYDRKCKKTIEQFSTFLYVFVVVFMYVFRCFFFVHMFVSSDGKVL